MPRSLRKLSQLWMDFQAGVRGNLEERALPRPLYVDGQGESPVNRRVKDQDGLELDEALTEECREILRQLDLAGAAKLIAVKWNHRLRSTAGYASFPSWKIELNPKLEEFDGQVRRTLLHELAHLVAYHRAGRRRIEPHGREWQQACADVGIPGETARHKLPLPRQEVARNLIYACSHCGLVVKRVRKFHRHTACSECCNRYNGGAYDSRFRFVLVEDLRKSKDR